MLIGCVPGANGCKSATQPWATENACWAGTPKMLFSGRSMVSSPVSTSLTGTDDPSTVTVGTWKPASAATAQARSSASFSPKNGGGSTVLHSDDSAVMKIFVPGFTVHVTVVVPSGTNGATVPPRSMQGSPPPNGLSGIGASSTVSHTAPSVPTSWWLGTADAGAAAIPLAATASSTTPH